MKKKIVIISALMTMLGTQVCHASGEVFMTINKSINFNNMHITEPLQIKAKVNRPVPKIGGEITAYIKVAEDGTYEIIRFGE